jgi:hypothetical protein
MITTQILEIWPGGARGAVLPSAAQAELARRFGLDRLPVRRRLVCHWHRDRDGRLAGLWEFDIDFVLRR